MDFNGALRELNAWAMGLEWKVLAAVLILLIGIAMAMAVRWVARLLLNRPPLTSQRGRLAYLAPYLAYVIILLAAFFGALSLFGLAAPIIGAVVTLGIALGAGADIYGGLRIATGAAGFRIGDLIEVRGTDLKGVVDFTSLFNTRIQSRSGEAITFPNRRISESFVVNHSAGIWPSAELRVSIDRPADFEGAASLMRGILAAGIAGLEPERVRVQLEAIEPKAVTLWIAFPVNADQGAFTQGEAMRLLADGLERAHVTVHSLAAPSKVS